MNTEKWRRLSRLITRRSEILKLWGRSLAENFILEYEMARINKEIKELHKTGKKEWCRGGRDADH